MGEPGKQATVSHAAHLALGSPGSVPSSPPGQSLSLRTRDLWNSSFKGQKLQQQGGPKFWKHRSQTVFCHFIKHMI